MCDAGRGLVTDRVAGEAQESPVVLSGPGQESDSLGRGGEVEVLLARNWKLNEFLKHILMYNYISKKKFTLLKELINFLRSKSLCLLF